MATGEAELTTGEVVFDQEKVEEIIEEFEAPTRRLAGTMGRAVMAIAVVMSIYHLYGAIATIPAQIFRASHLAFVFLLTFVLYPMRKRAGWASRVDLLDISLVVLGVAAMGYIFVDFERFIYRSTTPNSLDMLFGTITIILVLEATRRTVGWHLAALTVFFIIYALYGDAFPGSFAHKNYDMSRVIGQLYMTLEGIFGVPIDVSSTFIILFTIYGAVLEFSGAGKFFVDFSFAALGRKPTGAGRTVTLASFLLGGPSGSGVATTVTLGSIAYPMLRKAGYDRESAGGILSAGGIGAVLSPPILGAASFLIAEFLKISYLQVIAMSLVPTLLYYLSIFLMVELDARRMGMQEVRIEAPPVRTLVTRYWYQFSSLFVIVIFMALGFTAIMAVFWAIILAIAFSFIRSDTALWPPGKLAEALASGSKQILSVAATTAAAGIIVGVFTLTGLGLKLSGIIVDLAGANLFLALVYTAVAVWLLGLALPITASYIVAVVMAAPALIKLGVPDYAAHMFVFYYAILSEVSPPVGLSPFAAAAITGGNPYKTMMMAWKYTLPAFIVPFMFTLTPAGGGLLLQAPLMDSLWVTFTAIIGITALVTGVGGWLFRRTNWFERGVLVIAGIMLIYPEATLDAVGVGLFAIAAVSQLVRMRRQQELPRVTRLE